jgi:hypothetical protein
MCSLTGMDHQRRATSVKQFLERNIQDKSEEFDSKDSGSDEGENEILTGYVKMCALGYIILI